MTARISPAKRLAALLLALVLALSTLACAKEQVDEYQMQFDLGTRYLSDGNYEEAILAFRAAIEIEPKNAEAYLSLADVYLAMGDTASAVAVLTDALAAVDDVTEVQSRLALLTAQPEPEPVPLEPLEVTVTSQTELDALAQREDAKKITVVIAEEAGITDISALSALPYLTELDLFKNEITDISALSGLVHLTKLNLGYNHIVDISPLAGLTELTELDLDCNVIGTWNPLSSENGSIADFSPLSNLTKLTKLYLAYTGIDDVSVLSGLTELTKLVLGRNRISDLTPLETLTKLDKLYLYNNPTTLQQVDALQAKLPDCMIDDTGIN